MKYENPRQKIDEHTLMVNEIFYSIQGESSFAGKPCVFIRLTYCNLRCTYCDTRYAFFEGKPMSIDEVNQMIQHFCCQTVEITGGEPLLQPGVYPLMRRLCDQGYLVLLETSGSKSVENVDPRVIKILDFKCPSSGMSNKNLYENMNFLLPHDEVKFVIGTREDYDWSKALILKNKLHEKVNNILFSPVFEAIEPVEIVNWILTDKLQQQIPNIRFQLQLQKLIWLPETRGV